MLSIPYRQRTVLRVVKRHTISNMVSLAFKVSETPTLEEDQLHILQHLSY